ncbi:ATP-grasp domain-containing protein [Corallococcus sp. M34]|uniref:ATP-grasp domain-containing protein n=1 Tax=Citreicoccus inhibens TaxID=2849499 RepID=UPI001C24451B|nr:ATP-grasp domain-containing protein [Citreicoccus inhibens]MBU8894038.1 ATP-grasp domain-containing protein [Citreicoccus inhibens]
MVRAAFVQEYGPGRMAPEMRAVLDVLRARDVPVEPFTAKRLERRRLPLSRDTLVAGDVPTVLCALKLLGLEPPPTRDYPSSLTALLCRRVWPSTVRQLKAQVLQGSAGPVFAKPGERRKRFTGHVFRDVDDLLALESASASTPLWCSEVVEWRSEFRVFVIHGVIVGVRHYAGDPTVRLDDARVAEAVATLASAGEGTAGYAVDFGVLSTGETALVEWNDGFSLGAYGLPPEEYTRLTVARWCELMGA